MWDLIVSVPDHCLSFYFGLNNICFQISYIHIKQHTIYVQTTRIGK